MTFLRRSAAVALAALASGAATPSAAFLHRGWGGGPDGRALYGENCASCHGANLEGQPDWQGAGPDGILPPPPHDETGHTWHHGDGLLFDYVKLGGAAALAARGVTFESGMPGFEGILADDEITAILDYIKSTWPDRERQYQADRTAEGG